MPLAVEALRFSHLAAWLVTRVRKAKDLAGFQTLESGKVGEGLAVRALVLLLGHVFVVDLNLQRATAFTLAIDKGTVVMLGLQMFGVELGPGRYLTLLNSF